MDIAEKSYDVNGISLHVVEKGEKDGKEIMFLHGFPEFWYGWIKQIDSFAEQGFRVLVPDQRGYNLSSKPQGVKAYTVEQLTADIAALITQITDRKIILVGHDLGGNIAWMMGILYPQLLEKLIIINMPHPAVMKKYLLKNPKQMLKSWYAGFFQLPFLPEKISQAFDYKILETAMVKSAQPETFSDKDMERYKQAWNQPGALKAMINWYRAYKYSTLDTNKEVNIPALMIWGQNEPFLHHEMVYESKNKCKEGHIEFIQDATHWVHHEKPQQVNALMYSFIHQAESI